MKIKVKQTAQGTGNQTFTYLYGYLIRTVREFNWKW